MPQMCIINNVTDFFKWLMNQSFPAPTDPASTAGVRGGVVGRGEVVVALSPKSF